MNGTEDYTASRVTDTNNVLLGERPHHRALSLSSVASSSLAPTSIMGDLSSNSDGSDDDDPGGSPSKKNEVDRYGFTGGNQYTDPNSAVISIQKIRYREQKWLAMLNNWERWMSKRFSQVKNRCRKGIPPSLRGRAWQLLSGGKSLLKRNEGKFEEYLAMEADANCVEDIEKDLHRQFPFHEMFVERGGTGQQDLRDVLRAYSVYNREDGYCQAQAPIAAVLLMHMPAEEAFWCVVAMCEHYLQGYFSPGLEAIQVDGYVMQSLLRKVCPVAHKHLEKQQVSPVLYMTEWFMCVFARTLPWTSVLRLWDMFFCEGIKIVFRCALVLIRSAMGVAEKVKPLQGLYETMEALRKMDPSYMREERLMFEIVNLKVSERDLEHEHKLQKIKWKKDIGSAPPISNLSKDGKRVYRYTPTYHPTDTTFKHRTKSKQNISAVSVNSLAIIEQANETRAQEKKKAEKVKKQNKPKSPDQQSEHNEAKEERKPRSLNIVPSEVQPRKRSASGGPLVTSSSPITTNAGASVNPTIEVTSSSSENGISKSDHKNQRDELTVF